MYAHSVKSKQQKIITTGMEDLNNLETLIPVASTFMVKIPDGLVNSHLEDQGMEGQYYDRSEEADYVDWTSVELGQQHV